MKCSLLYTACTVSGAIPVLLKVRRFNKRQIAILLKCFAAHRYPNKTTLKKLALETGLHEQQVINWFKRERHRTKVTKRKEAR